LSWEERLKISLDAAQGSGSPILKLHLTKSNMRKSINEVCVFLSIKQIQD